eukprot:GEMP01056303.1.p1 GENE.GEMP01056303.1~~GEMP01056303.1.p1  ORF type:complete len:245 (+),score=30.96 GEMP01056303.1:150-884(+)
MVVELNAENHTARFSDGSMDSAQHQCPSEPLTPIKVQRRVAVPEMYSLESCSGSPKHSVLRARRSSIEDIYDGLHSAEPRFSRLSPSPPRRDNSTQTTREVSFNHVEIFPVDNNRKFTSSRRTLPFAGRTGFGTKHSPREKRSDPRRLSEEITDGLNCLRGPKHHSASSMLTRKQMDEYLNVDVEEIERSSRYIRTHSRSELDRKTTSEPRTRCIDRIAGKIHRFCRRIAGRPSHSYFTPNSFF